MGILFLISGFCFFQGYCSLSQVVSATPQSNVLNSFNSENEVVNQDLVKREEKDVEANNGRVMLIDGTSVIYRAYFKLLGMSLYWFFLFSS